MIKLSEKVVENEINIGKEIKMLIANPYSYVAVVLFLISIVIILQPTWMDDKGRDFLLVLFACTALLPDKCRN